jgi:hypothetical protein
MAVEQDKAPLEELARLYPEFSTEELEAAEENLRRFVDVAIRICEQAEQSAEFESSIAPLTDSTNRSTIRSNDKID